MVHNFPLQKNMKKRGGTACCRQNLSGFFFFPTPSPFSCRLWEHQGWGEGSPPVSSSTWWLWWQQLAPATQREASLQGKGPPGLPTAHRLSPVPPSLRAPQEIPCELTLDALLEMNEAKVKDTLRRCGASAEECGRLQYALTCLRKVPGLGGEHKEDSGWSMSDARRESGSGPPTDTLPPAGLAWPPGSAALGRVGNGAQGPRSVSVSALPASDLPAPGLSEGLSDTCVPLHASGRLTPRALHSFLTPPTTPQLRRHAKLRPPRTPPPPSRKVFQLLPSFPTLTRSKSHESQLGNRIDDVAPGRFDLLHGSPQMVRRDIGLSVTHRFSTKSWLSQVCHVCQKSMMFGVKCKHCRLKCHNKCTKEAPACRISFLPLTRLRRTESVPSDINNPVDRAAEPHFGTLPKALTKKEHPPAMNHLDSSSNPSSTTSSTPSSPAPFPTSSNPSSATTPPNPSPGQRDSRFNFPAASFIHHRQQFIFPGESFAWFH
nr:kinase suppressor of Ras 1-like isoform X2 [Microcebus murinus]